MENIFKQENFKCSNGFKCIPNEVGVYFLFEKKEVVYVGKSKNIKIRIISHRLIKIFDEYNYILCEKDSYLLEKKYISQFKPKYNKSIAKIPFAYSDKTSEVENHKTLLTENQIKLMWRDAAIRKQFKELNNGTNSIIAIDKYLSDKYKLSQNQIRNIIFNKGGKK